MTATELQEITRQVRELIAAGQQPTQKAIEEFEGRLKGMEGRFKQSGGGPWQRTFTDILIESKELINRPPQATRGMVLNISIATKDILGVSRTFPDQIPTIAGLPQLNLRVRNLIPSTNTTAGAVQYMRETSFTNNAAPVAEGAAKPKSEKTFDSVVSPIEVIAHYFKISKQSYEDLPALAAELDTNLIYGLDLKLEDQLLRGTGVSPQLQGIYPLATPSAAPPAGSTIIDTLFLAAAQLSAVGYQPTAAVVSSADWAAMSLLKDSTGRYLMSGGLPALPPLVVTPSFAAGEWLVGDFRRSHLFVREEANIQVAAQNEDDFVKNKLTALGELRMLNAVYQPAAFLKNPGVGRESEAEQPQRSPELEQPQQPRARRG